MCVCHVGFALMIEYLIYVLFIVFGPREIWSLGGFSSKCRFMVSARQGFPSAYECVRSLTILQLVFLKRYMKIDTCPSIIKWNITLVKIVRYLRGPNSPVGGRCFSIEKSSQDMYVFL